MVDIQDGAGKKRKRTKTLSTSAAEQESITSGITVPLSTPLQRSHAQSYHKSLLLENSTTQTALLEWFDSVSEDRSMPWRKAWINPDTFDGSPEDLKTTLAKRAYEVWVSEIMLQQTRVSTVISYFNNWISKWPTVQELAKADHDDVLAAWKGLGYYSRATRLHQGAAKIVEMDGFLPDTPELLLKIPGIGPYTAGAISSIAFGRPVPLLDGNVSRVLCRQLGLYADGKKKKITDLLWDSAKQIIQDVSRSESSDIPARWNQALMELGSTVCKPKPDCEICPIQGTCRVYSEGLAWSRGASSKLTMAMTKDIEDLCTACEPVESGILEETRDNAKEPEVKQTNSKISSFFTQLPKRPKRQTAEKSYETNPSPTPAKADVERIKLYCSIFPKKAIKGKVREEEIVVCIIKSTTGRDGTDEWLLEQRPSKGLLASLWQFPLHILPKEETGTSNVAERKSAALDFVKALPLGALKPRQLRHKGELGSLTHVLSHVKMNLHIHMFILDGGTGLIDEVDEASESSLKRRWCDAEQVDDISLWTGMQRCWELARK